MLISRWPRAGAGAGAGGPAAKRGVNEFLIVLLSWVIIAAGGAFVLRKAEREREAFEDSGTASAQTHFLHCPMRYVAYEEKYIILD